ncbi:putative leucine-rich repeat domain, L domain-containing protein [Medicago truncatula]|uniref:Putative leucine-rich repeat domain, L domain-containing protein n=1 Tax=Medicago truncatula TaxID=3880 RepID=A0A396GWK1_MEDTR|nr:putative leucine-rich repeat domain, L domain-containing protein [Medicago truncatula]
MKRKERTSSVKSSPENRTKRRKRISDFYLPDECWECVFRFIINDNNKSCLNSLSLVSKQFLSITNSLLFSLRVKVKTRPFLPILFERFTNLNTLDLTYFYDDHNLDDLLCQISIFPLKLKSLKLPFGCRFPAYGLQVFLQTITTLNSLTCCAADFCDMDLSPIVDCFPLLEHLELCNTSFNDQHVVDFSLFLSNLVSINLNACRNLTETTLFSLGRNCPSLIEIKMKCTATGEASVGHSDSLVEFGVYPQLKSLYLAHNYRLSDEIIRILASIFPNLELLDLGHCYNISQGISQVLRKCYKLKHLNLTGCLSVKLHGMNFAVPELEVLNLSETKVNDKTLYAISKNCCGLLQLLLEFCYNVTEVGVKHVLENCTQLREINLRYIHVSDKTRKLFSRRGCHIC